MKNILIPMGIILVLVSQMVTASDRTADVNSILSDVNQHPNVLQFAGELAISCIKVVAGKETYTVQLDKTLTLTDKNCKTRIKMSEERFDKIVDAEIAGDHKTAAKLGMQTVPFGLKMKLLWKCAGSEKCRAYLKQYT